MHTWSSVARSQLSPDKFSLASPVLVAMKKIFARQEAKRELIEESACSGKERICTANQAALQEYYVFHNVVEESLDLSSQWSLCNRQLLCNRLFFPGLTEDNVEERLCSHMRPVSELTLH